MKKNIFLFILIAILAIVCVCAYNFKLNQDREKNRQRRESEAALTKELQEQKEQWEDIGTEHVEYGLINSTNKEEN